jgi:hypothetical protein
MNLNFETSPPAPTSSVGLSRPIGPVWTFLSVVGLLVSLTVGSAAAGDCGDDVDGKRVPCGCGDVVVSDTRLAPEDPVTTDRCAADGLFLQAARGADSILLDLNGLSIVGQGIGSGLRVLDGGSQGAVILGSTDGRRAQVVAFGRGVHAHGKSAVAVLQDVDLIANSREGAAIRSSGASIARVRATDNGADGLRLGGHDSEYRGIEAEGNGGDGVRLSGSGSVLQAAANGNAGHGATVTGRAHDLNGLEATENRRSGVRLAGVEHQTSESRLRGNAEGDMSGDQRALAEAAQ